VDEAPELVASHFTLSGSGFGEPPRHSFAERCRAASDAGFAGIGLHADDLPRTVGSGPGVDGVRAVLADTGLRLVEIEFLAGWAFDVDEAGPARTADGIEAVADALGGRHVSAGEFRAAPDGGLALDAAATRLGVLARRLGARGLQVALEAFPWSALPDVATAVELLRRAGARNAG
jgi:sugar phosphate isomerase/epimerase